MADFTDSSKRRIAQTVTTWEKQRLSSRQRNRRELSSNSASVLVKTPSGGIPARSGTTLGKADCTIQEINKSTDGVSDGETISVYNPSATEISGDSYISAIRERTGEFIADVSGTGSSDLDLNCTFEIEIGSPDGIRPSQPTPVVRNFITQDSGKFYFDGVNAFSTVPCVIHYTGTYSFWPIRTWIRASSSSLYYWSGFQGLTGLSGRHSVRRMVQLDTRARVNRFFVSLPTLVSTQDPNTTGIRQPYHIPVGFTFIADSISNAPFRLVPDLTDEWPWPGLEIPDLEQLNLQVVAIEYNNTRVSG